MGLENELRKYGASSLDQPVGGKKYSLSAPDAGAQAAGRERQTNGLIDRNLQRAMRHGSPAERIAAGRAYQERSSQPGYQQGGGIQSSEGNQQRDQMTGDKFTSEGLRLNGTRPADTIEGQSNALPRGTVSSLPEGSTGRIWVNVGGHSAASSVKPVEEGPLAPMVQSATTSVTTPPTTQGEAANSTPAAPDWRQQRATALEALKGKFTKQDAANDLAEKAAPQGIDPKYQVPKETLDMESKFDSMIADRPADQKAMFSKMSESDKAAMVQKNESLKTVRKELDKIGPDKNSNAEQAKALIPGAKKEVQGLIDAADIMTGSAQDAFGDFKAASRSLKEERGAPTFSQDQLQSVIDGSNVRGLGQKELDPVIQSGNPLFDDPNGPSNSWVKTPPKPSSTKKAIPETGGKLPENASSGDGWIKAIGHDLGSVGHFAKDSFMGGRELVNKGGKLLSGAVSDITSFSPAVMQSFFPGETGRKIREINPAGKIKDAVYNATQFLPNKVLESKKIRPPDQASNDVKIQKDRTYDGIINSVRERSNFLQRYA